MLRNRTVRVPVACLLAALQLSACSQWTVSNKPLPELVNPRPAQLRIQLVSGQEMILYEPIIMGDSIVGGLSRNWQPMGGAYLHEVASVSTRKPSVVRTTILAVSLTAGLVTTMQAINKGLQADKSGESKHP